MHPFTLTQLFSNPAHDIVFSAWLQVLLNSSKTNKQTNKPSTLPCSYECFLLWCCISMGSKRTFDAWQRSGKHFHKITNNILKLFVVALVQDCLPPSCLLPSPSPPVVAPQLLWRCSVSWTHEPTWVPGPGWPWWEESTCDLGRLTAPVHCIAAPELCQHDWHGHNRKGKNF